MVRGRAFRLAVRRVIGVIEGAHHGGGGLGGVGDAVVDQGVGEPVEVLAVDAVCKPRKGGGTCQSRCGLQGEPLHAELQQRVVPETLGIMAIRIPGGDVINTLGQAVTERVVAIGGLPLGLHSGSQAFRQAHLPINTTEHQGAKVGR
jgi:hypothetical protein